MDKEILNEPNEVGENEVDDVKLQDDEEDEPITESEAGETEEDPFAALYEEDDTDDTTDVGADEKVDENNSGVETKSEKSSSEVEEAARKLLLSLGAKPGEDPVKALKKLTAEALGITEEEYNRQEVAEREERARWEKQAKADIEAIHQAFPETKIYKRLEDLPNKFEFAKLMDDPEKKLTAVAAFAASHTDIVVAHGKQIGKKPSNLDGTKSHIRSSVPKGARDNGAGMSQRDLEGYRDMFPDLSDREIQKLYKNATK